MSDAAKYAALLADAHGGNARSRDVALYRFARLTHDERGLYRPEAWQRPGLGPAIGSAELDAVRRGIGELLTGGEHGGASAYLELQRELSAHEAENAARLAALLFAIYTLGRLAAEADADKISALTRAVRQWYGVGIPEAEVLRSRRERIAWAKRACRRLDVLPLSWRGLEPMW